MLADHPSDRTGRDAEFAGCRLLAPVVGTQCVGQLALSDALDVELAIIEVGRHNAGHLHAALVDTVGELERIALTVETLDLRRDLVAIVAVEGGRLAECDLAEARTVLALTVVLAHFLCLLRYNIVDRVPDSKSMHDISYVCGSNLVI